MDDEGTNMYKAGIMFRPQPEFNMSERTIPPKNLNQDGKNKTGEMKSLYHSVPDSPDGTEKQEQYPKKMDEDKDIGTDFIKHSFPRGLTSQLHKIT